MIAVRLEGGLGNQLFQYGLGRAVARSRGVPLLLDFTSLEQSALGRHTARRYALGALCVDARLPSHREARRLRWAGRLGRLGRPCTGWALHREQSRSFDPRVMGVADQTLLIGYWQSWRYLESVRDCLVAEFAPAERLPQEVMSLLDLAALPESVAVHVRRGDYVSLATAARFHGALGIDYYDRAIAHVRRSVARPKFLVFSDDPQWAAAHLPLADWECVPVRGHDGDLAWVDLHLMSLCSHHIIANSSFSWWGAWLADCRFDRAERVVVAPKRWFASVPDEPLADRLPSHWVQT